MKRHDEILLRTALEAIKADEPEAAQVAASARRVAGQIGLDVMGDSVGDLSVAAIENCEDVRLLLKSYRAGTLSTTRSLMIEAHLRDCGECYRRDTSIGMASTGLRMGAGSGLCAAGWFVLRLPGVLAGSAGCSCGDAIDQWCCVPYFQCGRPPARARRQAGRGRSSAHQRRSTCRSAAVGWIDG